MLQGNKHYTSLSRSSQFHVSSYIHTQPFLPPPPPIHTHIHTLVEDTVEVVVFSINKGGLLVYQNRRHESFVFHVQHHGQELVYY